MVSRASSSFQRTRLVPDTLWMASEVGDTEESANADVFGRRHPAHAPKPVGLIERIAEISTARDSLILDSFAGSGTTAPRVLKANAKDGAHTQVHPRRR